jgi:RHS repeat-associated protein
LGTVKDLVNNSGTVVNHLIYDSFGNLVSQSNAGVDTRYRFTGREFDGETGLYYYRARYYDAQVGRFVGSDPIGFNGEDTNLYRYVGNSPINWTDPSGLEKNHTDLPVLEGQFNRARNDKDCEAMLGLIRRLFSSVASRRNDNARVTANQGSADSGHRGRLSQETRLREQFIQGYLNSGCDPKEIEKLREQYGTRRPRPQPQEGAQCPAPPQQPQEQKKPDLLPPPRRPQRQEPQPFEFPVIPIPEWLNPLNWLRERY